MTALREKTMKAAVLSGYHKKGRELEIRRLPVPEPGRGEVLVRIGAAGVNPLDNMLIRGEVRLILPYRMPLVMGHELAGEVVSAGEGAGRFRPGDRVYGRMPLRKIGAFAEYAAVEEQALALIPEYLSFEEAATVPLTALTALQAFELMQAKPGESIFISGGTGSLGAMAIPLAKKLGLRVIVNGSADGETRVRELGADRFIDYKKERYADALKDVDHVLDTLGGRELEDEFKVLKRGGHLVSLRGLPNGRFARRSGLPLLKRALFSLAGRKYDRMAAARQQSYDFIFVHSDGEQLAQVGRMFDRNHPLKASIDTVYPLDRINEALEKVRQGRSRGKTVITMRGDNRDEE